MQSRVLPLALLALVLTVVSPSLASPTCTCREGSGCYHYLNAPVGAPDDPCSCPGCRAERGSCPTKWPKGWNPDCAGGGVMECFLRRHAASWRISCSERLVGTCRCDQPHPGNCPQCGKYGQAWDKEGLELIKRQMKVERRIFPKTHRTVVAKSTNFYIVTDIPKLRVTMLAGGTRTMGMHEIAHVYLQRAEMARRDFIAALGDRLTYERPCAIFLLEKEERRKRLASSYLGSWEPELLYGADAKTISGGYGYNGLAISRQVRQDDDGLHFQMRHLMGHLFISCYVEGGGSVDILPKWMYAGAAHWLSRLPKKFEERATFCSGEGVAAAGPSTKWDKKVRKIAADKRATPIQRVLDESAFESLDFKMHIRAWSWFDVFLREDRDRFRAFLAAIRKGTDQREAMQKTLGCTPEEFDRRWRDRLLGRRPTVAPTPAERDAAHPTAAGAKERKAIREEFEPATLAARVRSLAPVTNPLTARVLVARLGGKSEEVREAIVLLLSKSRDARVLAWLRTHGLDDYPGLPRAQVIRILGNAKDRDSAVAVAARIKDPNWLVRAHAARTLGTLGRPEDLALLRCMTADRAPKVRLTAIDAITTRGRAAASAWKDVAAQLSHSAWPLRSASAECLGRLGNTMAVDTLIDRMEVEGGRIRQDIRTALKRITKDDLGSTAKYWRDWWEAEKVRRGKAPPPEVKKPTKADKYAKPPTYFSLKVFSQSVGYVIDASTSMNFRVELDYDWVKRHRPGTLIEGRKYDHAVREIRASLSQLDPRTRFNLYFFRTGSSAWKRKLVPATPGNIDSAVSAVQSHRPNATLTGGGSYRTNYVAAFRTLLDVKRDEIPTTFRDTPDTIFILTDGKPTTGDITDSDTLLSWFREHNRFARVRVNVITFGKMESNPEFLRRLATENGGRLIEIPRAE